MDEKQRLRQKIYELARTLQVNKDLKWNAACERDLETGATYCASVRYISDSTHAISGYAKVGSSRIIAIGNSEDIKKLEETIGP